MTCERCKAQNRAPTGTGDAPAAAHWAEAAKTVSCGMARQPSYSAAASVPLVWKYSWKYTSLTFASGSTTATAMHVDTPMESSAVTMFGTYLHTRATGEQVNWAAGYIWRGGPDSRMAHDRTDARCCCTTAPRFAARSPHDCGWRVELRQVPEGIPDRRGCIEHRSAVWAVWAV